MNWTIQRWTIESQLHYYPLHKKYQTMFNLIILEKKHSQDIEHDDG